MRFRVMVYSEMACTKLLVHGDSDECAIVVVLR